MESKFSGNNFKVRFETALLLFAGILPFELNGFYNQYLFFYPRLYWLVEIISWIILPIGILMWGIHRRLFTFSDIGFHTRIANQKNIPVFILCLLFIPVITLTFYSVLGVIGRSLSAINYGAQAFSYNLIVPKHGFNRFVVLVYMAVSAGVVEEIYYRGIFRKIFSHGWINNCGYVLLSSIVFSSIHWEGGIIKLLITFCDGILLAIIYLLTGNLWPLILGHFLIDLYWLS